MDDLKGYPGKPKSFVDAKNKIGTTATHPACGSLVRDEMILDTDLAPTFLDLAGLPIPPHMQGKSVLPLANAPDPSFRKEWYYEYFEWPNPEGVRPCRGIRTEQHKLIQYLVEPQEFELYDIQADPKEAQNLYGEPGHEALQKHLQQRLDALRAGIPKHKASPAA
jgi:arylsulfatase A-like enzyme